MNKESDGIGAAESLEATPGLAADKTTPAGKIERTAIDPKWLEHFYGECGREVTLAYTTLNQMKNWAMIIAGAVLSGLSFGAASGKYPTETMFIGVVIAYAFTLRFFVRAILCYINLVRWNTLQAKTVKLMLTGGGMGGTITTQDPTYVELVEAIENLYFKWHSPIDRKRQVLANLKLGFSLLLALSLYFLLWGAFALWNIDLVQGLLVFAVGNMLVEIKDFFSSSYFDTKEAYENAVTRRKKTARPFPIPESPAAYLITWIAVLLASLLVSFRVKIFEVLTTLQAQLGPYFSNSNLGCGP